MKLRELTGYKSNPTYQQAKQDFSGDLVNPKPRMTQLLQFQKYLMANGFTPLGSGQAGLTFTHPQYNWVFKIVTHDPAYINFLKYVEQNQNNPNLPKIKGKMMKINDQTYVIRLEKLQPVRSEEFTDLIKIIRPLSDLYDINELNETSPEKLAFVNEMYPGIYKVLMDMANMYPNYTLDFHRGNIMSRSNGTLVVIDPVAG